MKLFILLALLLTPALHAQERTASGALDNQMTWTALSNKAQAAADKADMVNIRVDQFVKCSKKGMDYVPGVDGADTDGCKKREDITKIIDCGKQGSVYSPETNACIKANQSRWGYVGTAPYRGAIGNTWYQGAPPPAGYNQACGAADNTARPCSGEKSKCHRISSSSSTTWQPQSCGSSDRGCEGNQNVTTTTSWYELLACE